MTPTPPKPYHEIDGIPTEDSDDLPSVQPAPNATFATRAAQLLAIPWIADFLAHALYAAAQFLIQLADRTRPARPPIPTSTQRSKRTSTTSNQA